MCKRPEDLDLEGIDTVAIDIETYDPNLKTKGLGAVRKDGFITGVAVATGKDTVYFGLHHSDLTTTPEMEQEFWNQLNKKILQNPDITKVFHNAMYDVCWLRATTGKMLQGKLVDTMIAASVIDENRFKYSLDSLSKDYLNDQKYKYDLYERASSEGIKDPMSNMHKLSYDLVKDYAKQDVDLTLKLWNLFNKKLDEALYTRPENNEIKTCRNIFELETKLFRCLVDMKFKGVRINVQKLEEFGKKLKFRRDNLLNIIRKHTGVIVQLWAANSIKLLLDQQKITNYKKTPKSGMPQLPKDYLKTHKNRFLRMLSKAREFDKAVNTFVEGLKGYVYNGRIHADVNQIRSDQGGTVTGRFSMSNPNLQQIPASGYIGKKMREIFLPEEGMKWGSFDYSQQEPRIVAHYAIKYGLANTEGLKDKFEKENADFHQIVADLAKIPRKQAKTINLGLFYGMGKGKLQNELNLDQKQATNLLKLYHEKIPFIKELSDNLKNFAERERLIYTLEDRFCRFNFYESTNKRWDNNIRKFEEWDPKAKEIKQKDGTITYEGAWVTPKLLSEKDAWDKFKSEFNQVSKKKIEEHTEQERQMFFNNYYVPAFTYKALNRLIQGSAADQTKQAMINCYKAGFKPLLQIHDELCFSINEESDIKNVKELMENAIENLKVPSKVDIALGKSWGEAKE